MPKNINLSSRNSFGSMMHIGKIIKEQVHKKKWSVSEFAQKINTNRNNVYNIFTRQSIDTQLLFTISTVLEHDFFQYYKPIINKSLAVDLSQANTSSAILQK
ncbi:MAG: helix-turn-helix transcriptional regulator [Chitinophagaceae bacterium]|nr:helix-turn-helix transcriptional regulator [Chitinophagaceae bacterium]